MTSQPRGGVANVGKTEVYNRLSVATNITSETTVGKNSLSQIYRFIVSLTELEIERRLWFIGVKQNLA